MHFRTTSAALCTSGIGIVLGLLCTSSMEAAPIFFTDRSAFETAAGGGLSFESFEGSFGGYGAVAFADFLLTEIGASPDVSQVRNYPGSNIIPAITDGTGAVFYTDNGGSIGRFSNFLGPTNAFGVDVTVSVARTISISGSVNFSFAVGSQMPTFFGVIDFLQPFTSIAFNANAAFGDNVGFDSASYGLVIPEPAYPGIYACVVGILAFGLRRDNAQRQVRRGSSNLCRHSELTLVRFNSSNPCSIPLIFVDHNTAFE